MVEPGLDSFLQTLDHVQLGRQTDDDDWGGAGLGDVKQVVQQCLKKTNWYFYFFSKSLCMELIAWFGQMWLKMFE